MRCKCCNKLFDPAMYKKDGKIHFEELCSFCRGKSRESFDPHEYSHATLTEQPLKLPSC